MKPRAVAALLALVGAMVAGSAVAQSDWRTVAVPAYTPAHFAAGQQLQYRARAAGFASAAAALQQALGRACDGDARERWQASVLAWARLSAVSIGALNTRRSARRIDFLPTRPARIREAAAGDRPAEQIGSAAKGFGALEWLLWVAPADSGYCRYAAHIAGDIVDEARALEAAFALPLAEDDETVVAAMSESINQWLGGVELLRMQWIVRPESEARSRQQPQPSYPRAYARPDVNVAERLARWETLRAQAVADTAPVPGKEPVPLEPYLRGKGLNVLADRVVAAVGLVDAELRGAGTDVARLSLAARRLGELKSLVEAEITPALGIRVGFSDADGD